NLQNPISFNQVTYFMAFAGTFFNKIKGITHGTSLTSPTLTTNLVTPAFTSHPQQAAHSDGDSSSSHSTEENDSNNNEHTSANYPGILDSSLTSLTDTQRNIFLALLTVLFILSLCGNLGTLFVNSRRKIRPFFRACLISLAFSDLMNTVFLTTAYLSQFTADYVQIWRLGNIMCSLVPFATTTAILASSMTLVGIAVDRYFAVMKAVMGFWKPSVISCIVCIFCIWLASIAIACPVFAIYDIIPVYILTEEHETATTTTTTTTVARTTTDAKTTETGLVIMMPKKPAINATIKPLSMPSPTLPLPVEVIATGTASSSLWQKQASLEDLSFTLVREQQLVNMCVSNQKNVSLYYAIVFVIIFIPCLGAFFWFNSIIARKLWKRRHVAAVCRKKTLKTNNKKQIPPMNKEETPNGDKACFETKKNCNSKSVHTSSTTVPSSLINTLGGKVTMPATKYPPTTVPICKGTNTNQNNCNVPANSTREARHLRMFTIILLMMAVFVFLRLPAWVFLLMRMYGNYTKPIHWIIYFSFGLMNLTSSVLNPLFYTFLTETIQYTLKFKAKLQTLICGCYGQVCFCSRIEDTSATLCQPKEHIKTEGFCSFLQASLKCYRPPKKTNASHCQTMYQANEILSKDSCQAVNNDKDEGVDCNDEIEDDENVLDFDEYNQRIFTIFPPSLVSSSNFGYNFAPLKLMSS
ncbi:hypothetical protein DOY81_006123, partial [Sarcophaga bullata]